jgi:hypothetical protein
MTVPRRTAVLLVAPLFAAGPAEACTKIPLPAPLGGAAIYFTGSATPDTVLAGAGAVEFRRDAGEDGPPDDRPIHGQLVRVDRIGGPGIERLPPGVREVVIVPWSYGAACEPRRWSSSARWAPIGEHGFFRADLRDVEHWVSGRPTFDMHNPGAIPYTGDRRAGTPARVDGEGALLSVDQVFDLHEALPSWASLERNPPAALDRLRAWARANPDLAARPPAEQMLSMVLSTTAQQQLRRVDHPVLGTWRFTLQVPGDTAYTFYARTDPHPTSRWMPSRARGERDPSKLRLPPAEGFYFLVTLAPRLDSLPGEMATRQGHTQSYISARAEPDSTRGGVTFWRGTIDSSFLRDAVPGDPRLEQAALEARERFGQRYRQGLGDEESARFTRGQDGLLRFAHTIPWTGGDDLVLTGEQISRTVVRLSWR